MHYITFSLYHPAIYIYQTQKIKSIYRILSGVTLTFWINTYNDLFFYASYYILSFRCMLLFNYTTFLFKSLWVKNSSLQTKVWEITWYSSSILQSIHNLFNFSCYSSYPRGKVCKEGHFATRVGISLDKWLTRNGKKNCKILSTNNPQLQDRK
jgi:hypothetical protein